MRQDPYIKQIEQLLQEIPALERDLGCESAEEHRRRLERALRAKNKRFELLIPFSFRQQLRGICRQAGIHAIFE